MKTENLHHGNNKNIKITLGINFMDGEEETAKLS
jgi:hypothetical protein